MRKQFLTLTLLLCYAPFLLANCEKPSYKEFDFWLGDWQVFTKDKQIERFNKITKINNGCSILEEYRTSSGYSGKSLNIYDRVSEKWHQTWVDSAGLLLQLSGKFNGKEMVMTGTSLDAKTGKETLNKISWLPLDNGNVKQIWQVSTDQGNNWHTIFDGLYQKRP